MLSIKKLLTKILQKLTFTPVVLYNTRTEATKIGTAYEYSGVITNLDKYNIVGIRFAVNESTQVCWMVRGTNAEVGLTDAPTAGRFRGTITVDWANNQIGIRCITAPNSRYDLVYFSTVYGIA